MTESSARAPEDAGTSPADGRRVDWLELFFDLAFVAFITQLAHGLHGSPGPLEFLVFVAWSIPAWWAWTNILVGVNLLPTLPARPLGIALLLAMGFVGLMAASVTDNVDRAWAFSFACAGLRLILLVLWLYRGKNSRRALWRTFAYNGATALIWIAAAFVPTPFNFALWALAILIEVLLLRFGDMTRSTTVQVDSAHASERLGLFMIILMGESVLSLVTSLAQHWSAGSGLAALLGFVAICALAWGFFVFGTSTMEQGLARLSTTRDLAGLLDTVMFLPYLLVIGVTMFAAGLATAVATPGDPLPIGAAISLGGGVALFYLTNAIVSVRWGVPWRHMLRWTILGVPLPLLLPVLAPHVTATVSLAVVTAIVVANTVGSIANAKHPETGAPAAVD
ncbi:MAG TPA: low temperature requirement protein A [Galbitalea sp.]